MGIPAFGTFVRVLADYVSLRFGWNSAWRLPASGSLNCPYYDYDYPLTTTSTAAGAYIYKTELIYLPLYPKLLPRSRRDEWHPAWAGVTLYEIRAYGKEVNATVSNVACCNWRGGAEGFRTPRTLAAVGRRVPSL